MSFHPTCKAEICPCFFLMVPTMYAESNNLVFESSVVFFNFISLILYVMSRLLLLMLSSLLLQTSLDETLLNDSISCTNYTLFQMQDRYTSSLLAVMWFLLHFLHCFSLDILFSNYNYLMLVTDCMLSTLMKIQGFFFIAHNLHVCTCYWILGIIF